ncbi:mannan endo-1,4-beta-mannosidase 2-like [Magnolia sinica]|uniref:mannan endo-1,4-beta-mannosidase 2-like n=1 Tax=Magnolia sinica TaxID=86752 RepID=UPI00265B1242|nr:mannan endo-1,4-beta-mannosidase 2-like [Magnolia sinica]
MSAGNGMLLYSLLGFASCIAFIYMSLGDLSFHFQQPKIGFVERDGIHFFVGGKAFYVNGWNSYWLMDQAVEEFSRPRVRAMFQAAAKMGLTVCRTWAFNDGTYNALQISPGHFDERVFKALDRVIAEARRHGIKLILSLVNNLQPYGGKMQYVKWALEEGIALSSSNDSFFFDPSIRNYFKTYLKAVLTRRNSITGMEYRDDPTIFAWELMNEPRCMSDASGDTLQDWIEEMARFVKSIDRNHLLTVGLEGFYGPTSPGKLTTNPGEWASVVGCDFVRNSNISSIDFASVHVYPDHWIMEQDLGNQLKFMSKWLRSHIEDGDRELRKPILFTEFGLSNKIKNFQPSDREIFFKAVFDIIYESARKNRSGAGALVWQLMVGGMEEYSDEYGIIPWERPSMYRLIKDQSCWLAEIRHRQVQLKRRPDEPC